MAIHLDNCCGCFDTRTGTIIIGSINLALSVLNMIVFILYLVLLLVVGTNVGVADHAVFIVAYVFIGIGILAALLQFFFCIMLIKGVKSREPKWVRVYLFIGTISLFLSLLSVVLGSFNIGSLIWSIIVAAVQIYFLIVIHSEYKNILAEREGVAVGESPVHPTHPSHPSNMMQKPIGFR